MTATSEAPQLPPTPAAIQPKATLTEPTKILFFIAARSHTLAEQFGVELITRADGSEALRFYSVPRPWLVPSPMDPAELTFDSNAYAETLDACSTYARHLRLFILNCWNPTAAKAKGWHFDFFAALRGMDPSNAAGIAHFTTMQVWP